MRSPFLAFVLVAGGTLVSGAPQREGPSPPTIAVETSLVMLPITVVDERGRLVSGLPQDAFTVYDNGSPQAIALFTNQDLPAAVGLVIDSSSSMRTRREDVTVAAGAFAELSHPRDELFTVNFNDVVWLGLPPHLPFTDDHGQLLTALARAPAQGMTALYDGIDFALDRLERGTHERKVLIVVSDGGDNRSAHALEDVLGHARLARAIIYTIVLADPNDRDARPDVMKKLAKETGGDVFVPRERHEVAEAFSRIARETRAGYMIGYSPPDTAKAGFRSIRVAVETGSRHRLSARTRVGYYVGRSRARSN